MRANLKDNGDGTGTLTISDGRQFTLKEQPDNRYTGSLICQANIKIMSLGVYVQCWGGVDGDYRSATEWTTSLGDKPILMD